MDYATIKTDFVDFFSESDSVRLAELPADDGRPDVRVRGYAAIGQGESRRRVYRSGDAAGRLGGSAVHADGVPGDRI